MKRISARANTHGRLVRDLEDQLTIFLPVADQHLRKSGGQVTVASNSKTDANLSSSRWARQREPAWSSGFRYEQVNEISKDLLR